MTQLAPVSYTHLDVYKRQGIYGPFKGQGLGGAIVPIHAQYLHFKNAQIAAADVYKRQLMYLTIFPLSSLLLVVQSNSLLPILIFLFFRSYHHQYLYIYIFTHSFIYLYVYIVFGDIVKTYMETFKKYGKVFYNLVIVSDKGTARVFLGGMGYCYQLG